MPVSPQMLEISATFFHKIKIKYIYVIGGYLLGTDIMTQGDVFEEFIIAVSPYVQEDQNI